MQNLNNSNSLVTCSHRADTGVIIANVGKEMGKAKACCVICVIKTITYIRSKAAA